MSATDIDARRKTSDTDQVSQFLRNEHIKEVSQEDLDKLHAMSFRDLWRLHDVLARGHKLHDVLNTFNASTKTVNWASFADRKSTSLNMPDFSSTLRHRSNSSYTRTSTPIGYEDTNVKPSPTQSAPIPLHPRQSSGSSGTSPISIATPANATPTTVPVTAPVGANTNNNNNATTTTTTTEAPAKKRDIPSLIVAVGPVQSIVPVTQAQAQGSLTPSRKTASTASSSSFHSPVNSTPRTGSRDDLGVQLGHQKVMSNTLSNLNLAHTNIHVPSTPKGGAMQTARGRAASTADDSFNLDSIVQKQLAQLEFNEFMSVLPSLVNNIVNEMPKLGMPTQTVDYMKKMLYYNILGGKMNRGIAVVTTYKLIVGEDRVTEEEVQLARILGWLIEWLQACFLIEDDIMDDSVTRRGKPCWFRIKNVGMMAVNDGLIMESMIYRLLKNYFITHPQYLNLLTMFQEVIYQTELGQHLDLKSFSDQIKHINEKKVVDINLYSHALYKTIVRKKTAYYTFYLPLAATMHMAGLNVDQMPAVVEITMLMGEYFQSQDDYLDCFGDPAVIGKIGTDIQEAKCTWLALQFLDVATPEQKRIFQEHYGRKESESVTLIKQLYRDVGMHQIYNKFCDDTDKKMRELIETVTLVPKDVLYDMWNKIYKRNK